MTETTKKTCNVCNKAIKANEDNVFNSNAENFRATQSLYAHKACLTGTGSKPIQKIEKERDVKIGAVGEDFVSSSKTKVLKRKRRATA